MDIVNYLLEHHNINLNEQQKEGVLCNSTSTLLLAVPGSGKTTVLVSRIANLILNYKVDPSKILTVTYSKESARDMAKRFNKLFGEIIATPPKFCTIHSLCYSVIKSHADENLLKMPTLMSDSKGRRAFLLRDIYKKFTQEFMNEELLETINDKISYVKNMILNRIQIQAINDEIPFFAELFFEFERYKKQHNLYEYDDMLIYCYKLFSKRENLLSFFSNMYQYINVDEAQDSSLIQYKIIRMLVADNFVFMVGDDDQSIYAFRGAYPQYLINFATHYQNANIIKMEYNYRSNSDIVDIANNFIKSNRQRFEKTMISNKLAENSVEIIDVDDYCKQYNYIVQYIYELANNKSVAVIYKNNDSAIPIINLLYMQNKLFYMKDSNLTFFKSSTVRDILAYFKLANDMTDVEAFSQIYYKLGVSKGVFEHVRNTCSSNEDVFSRAMSLSMLQDYKKEELNYYRYGFKKLLTLDAVNAIDYIMDSLGYKVFIESRIKDSTAKILSYQKLSILSTLAQKGDSINDFIVRLNELENNIMERKNIVSSANVTLTTMHSCKGLEFDEVILIDTIKDIIPCSDALKSSVMGELDLIESENRLFYVSLTRAKSKLTIYKSSKLNGRFVQPSCFVENLYKNQQETVQETVPDLFDTVISHTAFGKGIVIEQDNDILCVDFERTGKKSISYTFCKNADLIN